MGLNFFSVIYAVTAANLVAIYSGPAITIFFLIFVFAILLQYFKFSSPNEILLNEFLLQQKLFKLSSLFILWSLFNACWSVDMPKSISAIVKIFSLNLVGFCSLYLISRISLYKGQINKKLLTLLLIVINSLILFEHYSDFAISRLLRVTFGFSTEHMGQAANKATVLYTLLLPLLYHYICEKSWLYISLIIITIVNYLFHPMLAASLALVAAALVMLFIYRYGKNIFTLIFQGTIIFLISSPLLFKLCFSDSLLKLYFDHLPLSWQYRIHIWKNCLNFIWQKPFQGWGLNASRGLNEIAVYEKMGFIQNHPHNIGLQLWLENGLTGVVIICGLIYSFYHQLLVSASARSELAMWGGSFVATMVFANISLGIWQSWWVSSIWIVVLLYKMARAESNRS